MFAPGTRNTATSLRGSNATTCASCSPSTPGICTRVSLSPATTCAAVTMRSPRTNQPVPSTPTPQAVPITRTTACDARRITGSRSTFVVGGTPGARGPAIDGNGSMRASRCRRRRGGTRSSRRRTISERRTASRNPVCPGTSSAVAPSTQTKASPVTAPNASPPSESRMRNGVRRRPPRTTEPAREATVCRSVAPRIAPTRLESGAHCEAEPPCSRCGASRDPTYAPATRPRSESAPAINPRRQPANAASAITPSAIQSSVVRCTAATLPPAAVGPGYYGASHGGVVQLVRTPACHAGGRGFESRRSRSETAWCRAVCRIWASSGTWIPKMGRSAHALSGERVVRWRYPSARKGVATVTDDQRAARIFGVLFIITFVTSIPALVLYQPVLDDPVGYIASAGHDNRIFFGALLELLLILANLGTAFVLFPIVKRQNEGLALGYVAMRVFECTFILVGILAVLAIVTLRREDAGASEGTVAYTLAAIKDWTFLLGPGWVVGWGNGLILGYLMYRSQLVPRRMTWLGLVGGPLIIVSGTAVLFGLADAGGAFQGLATIPEGLWELSLGIYCAVRGFRPSSPILKSDSAAGRVQALPAVTPV